MAVDGIMLHIVKNSLEFLVGAKIEKVYQPSRFDLIITMKQGGTKKLLISADPERARVQLTNNTSENPQQPPMFCMLMRKHLCGGKLRCIRQNGLERVLYFDFDCINELGDSVVLTLACEIMGRYSNIILVNNSGRIIDSIRRVDAATSAKRLVLPGVIYQMPPDDNIRINFLDESCGNIKSSIISNGGSGELSRGLIKAFEGVSPLITREWTFYAGRGAELSALSLSDQQMDRLLFIIGQTKEKIRNKDFQFTILKTKEGRFKEYTFMNISQYGNEMIKIHYDDLFSMLDEFYAKYDRTAVLKQRANDIFKILLSNVERTSKRISVQSSELEQCAQKDEYKKKADLISAYLYMLKKGDACVYLDDFYEEGTPKTKVMLDPMMTPAENAQKYYKEYRKAVTAEKVLTERIYKGKKELEYFETVLDALSRAETDNDLTQIRLELAEQGYIKKAHWKSRPPKELPPMEYVSSDGFRILVGRNNKQNDKLTLKMAQKHDIWMHTQNIPGSHVIIVTEGAKVPESTMAEAARIAAYSSKAQNSDHVPVDYCLVKYVKKPPEAKPGMVIFSNYKTIFATPEQGKAAHK